MAFNRLQYVGEAAEHVRADRLALIGAGLRNNLVGGNAEMVRPEPHQSFDITDVGADGDVVAHLGFVVDKLRGQLRLRVLDLRLI